MLCTHRTTILCEFGLFRHKLTTISPSILNHFWWELYHEKPDYSFLPDQDFDWTYSVYGDVHEILPDDMPEPLGESVTTTTTMDANLNHCLATGKSLTGCLHFVNKTPVDWYSKKQATVETATYGSEFVAAKTATEQIMDIRQTMRYLGAPITTKSFLFGDNRSVVTSATLPHSTLT